MIRFWFLLLLWKVCLAGTSGSGSNGSGGGSTITETGNWMTSTSGSFSYSLMSPSKGSIYVSGVVGQSGQFFASGSAFMSGKDGSTASNTICLSGYAYSGQWNAYGAVGYKSLTVSGKAPMQMYSASMYGIGGTGRITVDQSSIMVTSGSMSPAFCGSYSASKMVGSGGTYGTNMFNANGMISAFDEASKTQYNYYLNFQEDDYNTYGSVTYNTMPTPGSGGATAMSETGSGCFTSLTRDETGMFSASGYIADRTFYATGRMTNGFWMADSVTAMSGMTVIGGSYMPTCSAATTSGPSSGAPTSSDSKCSGTFYSQLPHSSGQMLSGTMTKDGKWTAGLQLPTPFPEATFSGSYGSGSFYGSGSTLGLMWTANGMYGKSCFHTTSQTVSCGAGNITGLPSGYYGGCGSVHDKHFYASGGIGSAGWHVSGTVTESVVSGMKTSTISGTVTTGSNSKDFKASGTPSMGAPLSIQIGKELHTVTVFRLGETFIMAGQATSSGTSGP